MAETVSGLVNTPGIYYTIAYCLSSCLYIGMNERRLHGWRLVLTQSAIFAALCGFMVATDGIDQRLYIPCVAMEFFLLWLSICASCRMDAAKATYFSIRIENRYLGELEFRDGMPVTTKKDKAFHGFGTRSIRQTAEKYGGSMTIETLDGWFELRVLFPLPQKA